jgi:drug/metabolite transporter (DMT)-like permease
MRGLELVFGLIVFIAGAALLYNGVTNTEATQSATIIAGATFFSLGATILWNLLKNWWGWRREYRRYRNE